MAPTTNKKVLVVRFERESVEGFVQTPGGFTATAVELLTPGGNLSQLPYEQVKAVCFIRDFAGGDTWREHRTFASRPKTPGLWVRLVFRDGDTAEGIATSNLLLLEPTGFHVIPPDPTFQNQRVFVPRAALREVQVLGVIGSRPRRPGRRPTQEESDQLTMF
ncbi:MAG: hypothetical protein EXQ47_11500 [Bryobacterales bacterium]|nr:hypothetical protein [Bryobacterales bacterium]